MSAGAGATPDAGPGTTPSGPTSTGTGGAGALAVGAKLPHTGAAATGPAVRAAAVALEDAGFDSLWVSDHVVLPVRVDSAYPFAADGVVRWPTGVDYLEALMTLTTAAAVTSRVRLGTAVLVLPQRQPVLLAKQAASLDVLSGGRLELGVGAGWVAEEFAALGVPFEQRGALMGSAVEVLRSCWTGRHEGLHVLPAPARPIPLLLGGHSRPALRRAGRLGDGWLAQHSIEGLDPSVLATEVEQLRREAEAAGRDPASLRVVLRVADSGGRHEDVARAVPALVAAGVDEVVLDVDPGAAPERVARVVDVVRQAVP